MNTTKYLTRPEGRIAYEEAGTGDLVLLLPGIGALRSEYRFVVPALVEAGYRVIAADLRGHGESDTSFTEYTVEAVAGDILALIEQAGGGPAHIVGTSFSPGAAVYAAVEKPAAVRSLVLIGAFVRNPVLNVFQKIMMALLFGGPWRVSAWLAFYKSMYPTRKPDDFAAYLGRLKPSLKRPGAFKATMGLATADRNPSEERLSKVAAPALVVMGTKDPDWPDPVAEAEFIKDALGAELLLVEGAGHYPQTEMPDKVVPALLAFLGGS